MTSKQQLVRNALIIALFIVVGKKIVIYWKARRQRPPAALTTQQLDTIKLREQQATRLLQARINAAEEHLGQLRTYADTLDNVPQEETYKQINELTHELEAVKAAFNRKSSAGLFVLGPLAAPAQMIKERALKKRLSSLEHDINQIYTTPHS